MGTGDNTSRSAADKTGDTLLDEEIETSDLAKVQFFALLKGLNSFERRRDIILTYGPEAVKILEKIRDNRIQILEFYRDWRDAAMAQHAARAIDQSYIYNVAAAATDFPGTLALTGWWRNYSPPSPWPGTSSTGTSGSNRQTNDGSFASQTDPSAGTALGGHTTASYDGSTQELDCDGTQATYTTSTVTSGWVLLNPINVSSGYNVFIDGSTGTAFGVAIATFGTGLASFAFASTTATVGITTGWNLITWRATGSLVQIGVNALPGWAGNTSGLAGSSPAEGAGSDTTGALGIGGQPGVGGSFNGLIAEVGITNISLTDAQFTTGIIPYINTRYGLSLSPDVTQFTMYGLWRDYGGSLPWNGSASGGGSGSQNLTTGTAAGSGTALNGHGVASFTGASSQHMSGGLWSNFATSTHCSGWVLCNVPTNGTNNTTSFFSNTSLLAYAGSSFIYLYLRSAGIVGLGVFNGTTNVQTETTFTFSAWQLVQFKWDNSDIYVRVNGGSFAFVASVGPSSVAGNIDVGKSTDGTQFLTGQIADIGLFNGIMNTADFNQVRAALSARYNLTL